jgi:hypothetical protein
MIEKIFAYLLLADVVGIIVYTLQLPNMNERKNKNK